MSTTARTITPKKVREFPEYLDFDRLRAEGIRHIQDLAGKVWTDHNSHDPGITLLELLCYALTDVGYRTNLDIRDLLAMPPSVTGVTTTDTNFPTAGHILSCNPLTIIDLRKLLVDTVGVRNAWLTVVDETNTNTDEPVLKLDETSRQLTIVPDSKGGTVPINGLYNVLLELDDAYLSQQVANGIDAVGVILDNVYQKLQDHRNLCEDYLSIHVLRDERISLCGQIELTTSASPDDVMLDMLDRVQEFLSPTIPFYTLNERMAMGATPDQIFEGRPLADPSFGFVDTAVLEATERREVIHVSDIYRVLLDTEGVTAIKNLRLVNLTNGTNPEGEEWILPLTPNAFRPVLDALKSINSLTLSKRNVTYGVNADHVLNFFAKKIANRLKVPKKPEELDLPVTLGNYRGAPFNPDNGRPTDGLGDHFSIQNDLPAAYGTSEVAFPSSDRTPLERERQAQALQLKGYLLFFDQLLANYLSQLANVRSLFSTTFDAETGHVLSAGSLNDVAFVDKLLPFAAAPGPGNAIRRYFSEGDIVAEVIDSTTQQVRIFSTPTERDAAMAQVIGAFDNDAVTPTYPTDNANRIHFQIQIQGIHPVLIRSQKTYETQQEAEAVLGMVHFLATLETSYIRRQQPFPDRSKAYGYTFVWEFRCPDDFQQIMAQIVEDRTAYIRRKNNLFDHLLARFSEDFTDYTLLMFGLNKNTIQPVGMETMARDKAAFINAYPDISRNRSRGANQLLPASKYWEGNNISGIEKRLATMLGFNRLGKRDSGFPGNKQLNFFEIVTDTRTQFLFHDRRNSVLLQSPQPSRLGTMADFKYDVHEAAQEARNFVPFHAETDHVFGFHLTQRNGCPVAIHPDTYGSPDMRDAMLRYTRLVARDPDRLPVDFVARHKGFYAQILSPDGTPLFKAVNAASSLADARLASLVIRRAAADSKRYGKVHSAGKGFGFQLKTRTKTEAASEVGDVLAKHPTFYSTADERDNALARTLLFFSENPLYPTIQEISPRYYWRIPLPNEKYIKSIHLFKTDAQTRDAANRAVALPNESIEVTIQQWEDGTFRIKLTEQRPYPSEQASDKPYVVMVPLAQAEAIATRQEAEQISDDIKKWLMPTAVQIQTEPTQFYAELVAPDGGVHLRDTRFFTTADEAELAFDDVLEAACLGSWLKDDTLNNGCAHGLSLKDSLSGKLLAEHPPLYDTATERDEVMADIQVRSCKNRIRVSIEQTSDSWQFELVFPDAEGGLSAFLREPEDSLHATGAESQTFFNETVRPSLADFNDTFIENIDLGEAFSFRFNVNGQILAEHPERYMQEADRSAVVDKVRAYLTTQKLPETTSTDDKEPIKETEKIETILFVKKARERFTVVSTDADHLDGYLAFIRDDCPITEDITSVDRRRWRVRDAQVHTAIYQRSFSARPLAQDFLDKLILRYRCQMPRYSELVVGDGATPNGNHWVIRDKTRVMWQSPAPYASKAEARNAFEATLMIIMTASLNLDNYQLTPVTDPETCETRFRIDLFGKGSKPIAVSDLFESAVLAQQGVGERHEYAQLFPLSVASDGVYFQLEYNPENQQVAWRSTSIYPTWQKALDGFTTFIDMLGFESHYDLAGNDDGGWQIVLIDVLLEGATSFVDCKNTKEQSDSYGWEQVEDFLDRYQATDATKVAQAYVDYTDDCRYRFQLVSDACTLARHPVAFHTHADRECRRDDLFLLWQNQSGILPGTSKLLQAILGKVPAFKNVQQPLTSLFVVAETNDTGTIYLLGIRDETSGFPIVLTDETTVYKSEEALVNEVVGMYRELMADPIIIVKRIDGKNGFEVRAAVGTTPYKLAGLSKEYDFPRYEVLWESVATYDKELTLKAAIDRCRELLSQKTNYSRYKAADQSLTLTLTNPDEVLATHPHRYESFCACSQAIAQTLPYIDTEGFHLVEHVLLRPRLARPATQPSLLPITVREQDWQKMAGKIVSVVTDEADEFEKYSAGIDPYSMTATVVLPYWSRRFRSVDFRQFFENTLRRETPVHILLNIVWISPQQMQLFETRLRDWLDELNQPLSTDFARRTDGLVDIMAQLINTFPHAILNDCNGTSIILDETTLD